MPQAGGFPSRPRRWTTLLRSAAAVGVLLGSACHVYAPLEQPTPDPGSSVRFSITPDAARRVALQTGMPALQHVEGRFLESQGDSVRLSVLTDRDPRYAQQRLRQMLSFSRSDIVQMHSQVFSGRRTALLSVGAVGLLALLIRQYESSGGDPGPSNGPDPAAPAIRIRIPIFR